MTNVDYEALGLAAYDAVDDPSVGWEPIARAVVAALRDQGLVVVRQDDVERALEWRTGNRGYSESNVATKDRLESALAAPGDGKEENNG